MKSLFIGIDAGGTHSTAVAACPDGRIAAVACGEGMNFYNVGVDVVRARLEALVRELQAKCGGAAVEKVCVGMSALDYPADEATLRRFTGELTLEQLDLQSDAYIALMGFTQGAPGVIVICGTGSMLLRVDSQGRQKACGGWGYLLGDAGSGYTLAREGLLAVIDHCDGLGGETALTGDALGYFRVKEPRELIERVYAPDFTPDKMAGFARCVLQRAEEGDGAALTLLERNMKRLARLAAGMIQDAPEAGNVGLYGGIFEHSGLARRLFEGEIAALSPRARVCGLEYPPELGAIIHLMKDKGALTQDALERMKSTYKELQA